MNIIGLGEAGCNLADKFKQHSQYEVYKINTDIRKSKHSFKLKKQLSSEAYEEKFPVIKNTFFKEISEETLFITSCGFISGATLKLLQQLKNKCKISILYIKPDVNNLSLTQSLQNNLLLGALQEYARSAVFERFYIVENPVVEATIGDIPVKTYYDCLNETIVSSLHMINIFENSKPVMSTFSSFIPTARISTFGMVDYKTGTEKLFFNLDTPREKRYYYALPKEMIESDGTTMKNIKEHINNNRTHVRQRITYGIYETNYKEPYVYCLSNSSLVQKNEKNT